MTAYECKDILKDVNECEINVDLRPRWPSTCKLSNRPAYMRSNVRIPYATNLGRYRCINK